MLFDLLSDLVKIDDILFIIKSSGATGEIKSTSLGIRQKEKWITIGANDGPAHFHVNSESIKSAEFIQEPRSEKISFSVRFFDENNERTLAAFFTKMYDESKIIIPQRKQLFDELHKKYSSKIQF